MVMDQTQQRDQSAGLSEKEKVWLKGAEWNAFVDACGLRIREMESLTTQKEGEQSPSPWMAETRDRFGRCCRKLIESYEVWLVGEAGRLSRKTDEWGDISACNPELLKYARMGLRQEMAGRVRTINASTSAARNWAKAISRPFRLSGDASTSDDFADFLLNREIRFQGDGVVTPFTVGYGEGDDFIPLDAPKRGAEQQATSSLVQKLTWGDG